MKKEQKSNLQEKLFDFSDFKVKDLSGRDVSFEGKDPVLFTANNLYIACGDIAMMRKIERLYDEKKISLTTEEKDHIITLLEGSTIPVNTLIKYEFIKTLNK